jgi:hypothetical protein
MKVKKYKKAALNIAILTMILSAGLSTGALAATNVSSDIDSNLDSNIEINQASKDRQEKIISTFEANDYAAWKKMIGENSRISGRVQEADFHLFIAARQAARSGEYDKAIKLTESLKKSLSL